MPKHILIIEFETDRELTEQELDDLRLQTIAQVEEPVDENGDDVAYRTNVLSGVKIFHS